MSKYELDCYMCGLGMDYEMRAVVYDKLNAGMSVSEVLNWLNSYIHDFRSDS